MATAELPVQRRRHPWRWLAITLVVLLALLVVADRVAAAVASARIASELQTKLHTAAKPKVSIQGFPLLTQAIAGRYDQIEVDAAGVAVPNIGKVDVHLDLKGVKIALSDALAGRVAGGTVSDARADVRVSQELLSELSGLPVTVEDVTGDVARLSTTFNVFGQQVPLTVDAMVVVEGKMARLEVQDASAAGVDLPSTVVSKISDMIGVKFEIPTFAEGMHLDSVSVRDGAIVLHASGTDVPFPTG